MSCGSRRLSTITLQNLIILSLYYSIYRWRGWKFSRPTNLSNRSCCFGLSSANKSQKWTVCLNFKNTFDDVAYWVNNTNFSRKLTKSLGRTSSYKMNARMNVFLCGLILEIISNLILTPSCMHSIALFSTLNSETKGKGSDNKNNSLKSGVHKIEGKR